MQQIPFTAKPERIADLPAEERPASRLRDHGADTLSDSELLAVLLDCDTMAEARDLASRVRLNHTAVAARLPQNLAARYLAAVELHRRLSVPSTDRSTLDVAALGNRLVAEYRHAQQEHLTVTLLDSRNNIIAGPTAIYVGTINSALVSTRDIIRAALDANAVGVVVHHNHPSGNPCPSAEDLAFTRKLDQALQLVDVALVEHIVSGAHGFWAMRQRGQF